MTLPSTPATGNCPALCGTLHKAPQRIVFLAATGEQAAFSVQDGIATQRDADPAEWAQLIDMIEAGGQIAVVTARDAFTLDQDALPELRCR